MNVARKVRQGEITNEEASWLMEQPGIVSYSQLASLYENEPNNAFIMKDGRVLWVRFWDTAPNEIWGATIFETKEIAEYVLRNFKDHHVHGDQYLSLYFLEGKDFVNRVPVLIDQLSELLGISRNELNCSFDSLQIVSEAICRYGYESCEEPNVFAALIAYIGEVLIRRLSGRWTMEYNKEQACWEPNIRDDRNRRCFFWVMLMESLDLADLQEQGDVEQDNIDSLSWVEALVKMYESYNTNNITHDVWLSHYGPNH
jgi:hypothetical protein